MISALSRLEKTDVDIRDRRPRRYIKLVFLNELAAQGLVPTLEMMRYIAHDLAMLKPASAKKPRTWPNYLLRAFPLLACPSHFDPSHGVFQEALTSQRSQMSGKGQLNQPSRSPGFIFLTKCIGVGSLDGTDSDDLETAAKEISIYLETEIKALKPSIIDTYSPPAADHRPLTPGILSNVSSMIVCLAQEHCDSLANLFTSIL